MLRTKTGVILLSALALLLIPTCGVRPVVKERALMMGTVVDVVIHHDDRTAAEEAAKKAFQEAGRLEKLLAASDEGSEVSLINRNAGIREVRVSEETFFVIEQAVKYSELSGGAFDITVMPILELWGFGSGQFHMPGEKEISEILPLVDYRKIVLDADRTTVKLAEHGMKIDLGGIAKGYVVDRMAGVLRSSGISGALVNAGGDIYALGSSHAGSGWRVGVRHPRDRGRVVDVVELKNEAIATSGDYEKYFIRDNRRFPHIFDPRDGMPVKGMMSVTVVAGSAMEADALSTLLFVLGEETGRAVIAELGAEAIFYTEDWDDGT